MPSLCHVDTDTDPRGPPVTRQQHSSGGSCDCQWSAERNSCQEIDKQACLQSGLGQSFCLVTAVLFLRLHKFTFKKNVLAY